MYSTASMLSQMSHFINPDYIQPLPTTLDAKKSPLALLAQTCNSIGKDSGDTKEDGKDGSKDAKKSSSSTSPGKKRSDSPGLDKRLGEASPAPHSPRSEADLARDFSTPPPKELAEANALPDSASDRKRDEKRPGGREPEGREGSRPASRGISHSPASSTSSSPSAAGHHSNSKISLSCGSVMLEVNHHESSSRGPGTSRPTSLPPATANSSTSISSSSSNSTSTSSLLRPEPASLASAVSLPSSALSASYPPSSLSLLGHHPGYPYGLESSLYPGLSGAAAAHKAASMAQLAASASPYLAYTSVKTSTGATTLVPVCKDPYCHHCQLAALRGGTAHPGGAACAAGCVQCSHDKALGHAAGLASGLGGLSGLSAGSAGSMPHPLASSLYPHAYSVLPGHHSLPYVCNWVAGSEQCGKRFSSSEELLQHLRTHTSAGDTPYPAALGLSGLGLAAPGLPGCPSAHFPASLSPGALRHGYPRSLSPNSLLAASRFHPYKSTLSPLATPPSAAGLGALPPSLAAYYPYSLYGQRLGAS